MNTKVQLQKNAAVITADGRRVGSLERVVVNPRSKALTDIVVSTGALLNREEKVVPIGLVTETTESQVVLSEDAGDLVSFPAFEEEHLVEGGEYEDPPRPVEVQPPVVFGYPGLGPPMVTTTGEQLVTEVEQNIPEGTVAMKESAKIITADGEHVGNLERVLAEPSLEQITHLLISMGGLMKKWKLIPIQWVMVMGEDEVHLRVKKTQVEELADTSMEG